MRFSTSILAAYLASIALAASTSPPSTDISDVYAARATAKSESPISHVK